MGSVTISVVLILISYLDVASHAYVNLTCGRDHSPVSAVYKGLAAIETYPWIGMLYYPTGDNLRFTTSVVLVTRQIVIATASEIDKLPKAHFRDRARVVLGRKCGQDEIRVRDYTYHPEYDTYSTSALAMVQLETDHVKTELHPICQPPAHFRKVQFYAMTLIGSCKNPKVRIHKMEYVNNENCTDFYRKNGLDQKSLWPVHSACARSVSGGRCVWRSGSVLAVKQDGRWRLLGFSVYGPGCGAPSRFLHYGVYQEWIRRASSLVGQPAITRLGDDHIVMRRALSSVQRYGPCDPEEKFTELYSDRIIITWEPGKHEAKYNVTLYAAVEYSCIVFKVRSLRKIDYNAMGLPTPLFIVNKAKPVNDTPRITLRRWCATTAGTCHDFQHLETRFYVFIKFSQSVELKVHMYGRAAKSISAPFALRYINYHTARHPSLPHTGYVRSKTFHKWFMLHNKWFYQKYS